MADAKGFDVSNNNGRIDWEQAAKGHQFAYSKVSEGLGYLDSFYGYNLASARAEGLVAGGYHYGRPGEDAVRQAEFFHSHLDLQWGDLPPVLDLEVADGSKAAEVGAWAEAFLHRLGDLTGCEPILYSYFSFLLDDLDLPVLKKYPLWFAYPGTEMKKPPDGFRVVLWQNGWNGHLGGTHGNIDTDVTVNADLKQITWHGTKLPAPKPVGRRNTSPPKAPAKRTSLTTQSLRRGV